MLPDGPGKLKYLKHPKVLNMKQEEWLRWHEILNGMRKAQMRTLCETGVLLNSLLMLDVLPL